MTTAYAVAMTTGGTSPSPSIRHQRGSRPPSSTGTRLGSRRRAGHAPNTRDYAVERRGWNPRTLAGGDLRVATAVAAHGISAARVSRCCGAGCGGASPSGVRLPVCTAGECGLIPSVALPDGTVELFNYTTTRAVYVDTLSASVGLDVVTDRGEWRRGAFRRKPRRRGATDARSCSYC